MRRQPCAGLTKLCCNSKPNQTNISLQSFIDDKGVNIRFLLRLLCKLFFRESSFTFRVTRAPSVLLMWQSSGVVPVWMLTGVKLPREELSDQQRKWLISGVVDFLPGLSDGYSTFTYCRRPLHSSLNPPVVSMCTLWSSKEGPLSCRCR